MIIGIQGGAGSFNEEAITAYITRNPYPETPDVQYLYTTEAVFAALARGDIQLGQFALLNGVGGLVQESLEVIARYSFQVVDTINIAITHHLMRRKDVSEITSIMAHPQVFQQCAGSLARSFGHLALVEGRGDLIDTARAAEQLAAGILPLSTAILGPRTLAARYNFDIIAHDLQDSAHNVTTFVVIKSAKLGH
jgi:prephenate dehydratase